MSPTVFRVDGFRFFFFSREETRMHIHIYCADGEAKYWLEPKIELAKNYRIPSRKLTKIEHIVEDHYDEIKSAWQKHFIN